MVSFKSHSPSGKGDWQSRFNILLGI